MVVVVISVYDYGVSSVERTSVETRRQEDGNSHLNRIGPTFP